MSEPTEQALPFEVEVVNDQVTIRTSRAGLVALYFGMGAGAIGGEQYFARVVDGTARDLPSAARRDASRLIMECAVAGHSIRTGGVGPATSVVSMLQGGTRVLAAVCENAGRVTAQLTLSLRAIGLLAPARDHVD